MQVARNGFAKAPNGISASALAAAAEKAKEVQPLLVGTGLSCNDGWEMGSDMIAAAGDTEANMTGLRLAMLASPGSRTSREVAADWEEGEAALAAAAADSPPWSTGSGSRLGRSVARGGAWLLETRRTLFFLLEFRLRPLNLESHTITTGAVRSQRTTVPVPSARPGDHGRGRSSFR